MDAETIVKIGLLVVIGACGLALGWILWPTRKPKKRKRIKTVAYPADKETKRAGVTAYYSTKRIPRGKILFTMDEILHYFPDHEPIKVGKVSLGTVGDYRENRGAYE